MSELFYLSCNECGEYFLFDEEEKERVCCACASKDVEEFWAEARVVALAKFECVSPLCIAEGCDCYTLKYGKREYIVATDEEANELWDEYLESYIDELILVEMPEYTRHYFDREAWKRDARMDGRGHSLNRYNGSENMVEVDGEEFYIYRR